MKQPDIAQSMKLLNEVTVAYTSYMPDGATSIKIHCLMVACCAEVIASSLKGVDSHLAYIMGLLHDYGKIVSDNNHFHGLTGYKYFMKKGWTQIARTCLTHSFIDKDFNFSDYSSYNVDDLYETKEILKNMEYDIYDKIIQMSDMIVCNVGFKRLKDRMLFLRNKYGLPSLIIKNKYRDVLRLKKYFDTLCGCDIYKLLGID